MIKLIGAVGVVANYSWAGVLIGSGEPAVYLTALLNFAVGSFLLYQLAVYR